MATGGERPNGGGVPPSEGIDPEEATDLSDEPPTDPPEYEEPELPARRPSGPEMTADGHHVAPDPDVGDTVAGYELLSVLGRGGAGSVFRARRVSDGETVALKVLAAAKTKRARVVQRFFDEVRAATLVQHEGLIRIHDFVEQEEPRRLAYAMEYFAGEMLRRRLERERALNLRSAIQIAIQICDALAALHQQGIVHRDLKPENIMVAQPENEERPPRVKLLDFGVVKFLPLDRTGGDTQDGDKPGTFVGTPRYMAPEQAAGATVTAKADLFSVGVMLFEMITGRCPHEGDSLRDVVMAKLKGAPRITVNPEKEILPHELTEVVDACLQLKPSLRPRDAKQVANALRDAEIILFAVGPIRAGAERRSEPPEASWPDRSPGSAIEVVRTGPRRASGSGSQPPSAAPTPATPSSPAAAAPPSSPGASLGREDGSRRLIAVLVVMVVLAGALVAVLVARRMARDDAVLLLPSGSATATATATVSAGAPREP